MGKIPWRRKWHPPPVFLLAYPLDKGAWQAKSMGLQKSQNIWASKQQLVSLVCSRPVCRGLHLVHWMSSQHRSCCIGIPALQNIQKRWAHFQMAAVSGVWKCSTWHRDPERGQRSCCSPRRTPPTPGAPSKVPSCVGEVQCSRAGSCTSLWSDQRMRIKLSFASELNSVSKDAGREDSLGTASGGWQSSVTLVRRTLGFSAAPVHSGLPTWR